ncbi:MAG: helix-turn-helix transcriptional regulator [Desulfovibrio sp.]|uniref:helix-turn-helix domain-containing protein n=1 Tax=Desulfovibrio sp. TaxID=885 RepID=UPI001A7BDE64|nr:helix-turn-helix transcriptional regulator [Desulfovibrio sp.]MBD5416988.1 helix-turn-helix transcriptional regulator [Desulfovibrio sp.]
MRAGGAVERARAAWGAAAPDWILRLAEACDARSIRQVAVSIKVSPALVSRVINARYAASLDFLAGRVRAMLMAEILACPALGMISAAQCQEEQGKPFVSASPLAVSVYRACRNGCRHFNPKNTGERHVA